MARQFTTVGFLGAGRTAAALAVGMAETAYPVVAAASRSLASAQALASRLPQCTALADPSELCQRCDVVFLTVPDDAIASAASVLPWRQGQGAVHCSGSLSLKVLADAREKGAAVGALHPLQAFASREYGHQLLAGSTFAIQGEGALGQWLQEVALRLKGHPISLKPQDGPLYHAAAVMSCGYVTTLLHAASSLWKAMGYSSEEALRALLPLARGTLSNMEVQGIVQGATGPMVRGDTGTIERHLKALSERAPEVLPLYCQAGMALVALAQERGSIGREQASELRRLLRSHLAKATKDASGLSMPEASASLERH